MGVDAACVLACTKLHGVSFYDFHLAADSEQLSVCVLCVGAWKGRLFFKILYYPLQTVLSGESVSQLPMTDNPGLELTRKTHGLSSEVDIDPEVEPEGLVVQLLVRKKSTTATILNDAEGV